MLRNCCFIQCSYADSVFKLREMWTYFKWISLEVQTQSRSVGSIEDHLWWKSMLLYETKLVYSFLFLLRSIILGREKSLVKVYQFNLYFISLRLFLISGIWKITQDISYVTWKLLFLYPITLYSFNTFNIAVPLVHMHNKM